MTDLVQLGGIGDKLKAKFNKLGILSITDLIFHLPRNYQDRTKITPISQLVDGHFFQVEGKIIDQQIIKAKRKMLQIIIDDGSNYSLKVTFFHFYPNQLSQLKKESKIRLYGQVKSDFGLWQMIHPEYQIIYNSTKPLTDQLTPIYPSTEGLSSAFLGKMVKKAFTYLEKKVNSYQELLPNPIKRQYQLMDLKDALFFSHYPNKKIAINELLNFRSKAQIRLILEELVAHRLSMQQAKFDNNDYLGFKAKSKGNYLKYFIKNLPFKPTNAQLNAINEIQNDLKRSTPMARLVQGDVGSGKTVIAAAASALILEEKLQVAIMAPTEILAEQHDNNFKNWFEKLDIEIAFLANKTTKKQKEKIKEKLKSGEINLLIGTHAIFQEDVEFKQLGLIIIDEQHRFGVKQRYDLLNKGISGKFRPHQLVMSATPIPRTLTMTVYGDLDISIINELPRGRKPIETHVISNQKRPHLINKLKQQFNEGTQVYWVCPLIEESEVLADLKAAEDLKLQLSAELKHIKIGLIHGKMKPKEKASIMQEFKDGKLELLVATTVIEVGVDVPNASIMIIENPERLGLSQLHQLRGRVGRGEKKGTCILLYHPPLSQTAKARLNAIRQSTDGFLIAEKDLQLRGPGELLGTRQTGNITFKIADLIRDGYLLSTVNQIADEIGKNYPDFIEPLINRWLGEKTLFKDA